MFSFTSSGSFSKTLSFLSTVKRMNIMNILDKYGQQGVNALSQATPVDSGIASSSWSYEVTHKGSTYSITWKNSDVENGFPVAVMIQYGYGTGTGGFVHGRDFINPAVQPIFDRIADEAWKVVTTA